MSIIQLSKVLNAEKYEDQAYRICETPMPEKRTEFHGFDSQ
jgi:hypothetical protein